MWNWSYCLHSFCQVTREYTAIIELFRYVFLHALWVLSCVCSGAERNCGFIFWIIAIVNLVIIRKVWLPCSTSCSCCLRTRGHIEAWNSEAFLTMFWWHLVRCSFQMWWLWCIWSGIKLFPNLLIKWISFIVYICKRHTPLQTIIILPQISILCVALWHFVLCAHFKIVLI